MARKKIRDELRYQLALSQDHMALWLGISRSLCSLHELNLRSLPTNALIKYSRLKQAWNKFGETWIAQTDLATKPPTKAQLKELRKAKHLLFKAQYALENLEFLPDYKKARAFFESLQTQVETEEEKLICRVQLARLEVSIEQTETQRQNLLAEIEVLQKKIGVLERGIPADEKRE